MTNTNVPPEFFADGAMRDGSITDGHAPVDDERPATEGVRDDGMDADGIDITAPDGPPSSPGTTFLEDDQRTGGTDRDRAPSPGAVGESS